ncbi:MAG TPA: CpaD family pilus assembly lipoprotein [Stellaceae bacterium]|jgi:type IV pilus biogenesis protein CpaD/CtpE
MRALIAPSGLLLIMLLAGCNNMVGTADPPYPIPEDPNPFTYKTVDYPYAVRFVTTAEAPAPGEMTRLQDFLKASSARPGDKVTVSGDNSSLGQARSARLREALKHAGLDPVAGVDVNLGANTVSLVVEEIVAVPPHCDDWPVFAGDQPSNAPSMSLGCALRNNLYQMVVDKRDLAVGQTPGPADAEPSMRAVQKYREGIPDKNDKGQNGGSNSGDNSAAESATAAAGTAAGLGGDGATPTAGPGNDQ